tara:strand:- start:129 stop:413 length:285 start_codon:yes stop_codon:yes gene_type:complete
MKKLAEQKIIKVEAGEYTFNGYTIIKDVSVNEWMAYETAKEIWEDCFVRWFDTKKQAVDFLKCAFMYEDTTRYFKTARSYFGVEPTHFEKNKIR